MQICYTSRNIEKWLEHAETVLRELKSSENPYEHDTILVWDKALYKLTDIPKELLKCMPCIAEPVYSDEKGQYYHYFDLLDALTFTVDDINRKHYAEQICLIVYLEAKMLPCTDSFTDTNQKKWGKN